MSWTCSLPDARFDLVLVESVIAFVEDKDRAIAECVRVTRAGGLGGRERGGLVR